MKTFFLIFLQTFKTQLVYRPQLIQRLLGLSVYMMANICFWFAASKTQKITIYTSDTLLFYFAIAGFHDFLLISGDELVKRIGESIRMGKMSASLIQPYSYLYRLFAIGFGGIAMRLCLILPIALVLKFTLFANYTLDQPLMQISFYALALFLGVLLNLTALMVTGFLAFDMVHVWVPWIVFVAAYVLLSGFYYPADLATGFIGDLMHWTPFYYFLGFPALILTGRLTEVQIWEGFMRESVVFLYLIPLLIFMWRRGLRKFEAIGL